MSFFNYIRNTKDKATARMFPTYRLMSNAGSPLSNRRRLLMNAVQSGFLYGSEVWADSLGKEIYRKHLTQLQGRETLRVVPAYRTVSEPAVMAGAIPIALHTA